MFQGELLVDLNKDQLLITYYCFMSSVYIYSVEGLGQFSLLSTEMSPSTRELRVYGFMPGHHTPDKVLNMFRNLHYK